MITVENLDEAISEAVRFIKKADEAREKLRTNNRAQYGCKETGSVKRSSMDLTRALSKLRK